MAVLVAMGLCTSWCILHSQTSLICLALLFIGLRCLFHLYAKYYHSSGVYAAAAAADGHWERGHFNRNVHRWNNHLGHWIWIKLDINGIANCINLNGLLYCAHSLAHLPNANKNHQLLNSQSDTNPMPIHNKYSIFNKQTNPCAQIFHTHTKTHNTHIQKCLCTLRHSADLFVYIFTCSLELLLCFLVCTCISAFWIDVCGRDGKVRERKQTIYLLKHWLILLFGIYCECLMAYRLWPSLFMIFFPSVICLRHSIVYNIAHWCILLAHFDHFTQ